MAKIIFTSRYFKNAKSSKLGKLVKYMGTREGVEKLPVGEDHSPSTVNQQRVIKEIISKMPYTKEYPEYKDYENESSKCNASEFIDAAIERNADKVQDSKKLVSYIAERPGVEKLGKHGLFSLSDDKIDLDKVSDEVSNHEGIVWTHVVSLKREDAERLGYNNADEWKSLMRRKVFEIAEAHKIKPSNLKIYAAFHNTTHHPHMHMLVYSNDPNEGYLTKKQIDNLRSTFGNDIFRNEQYKLFQAETLKRDEIKSRMRDILNKKDISQDDIGISYKLNDLAKKLEKVDGKKKYGYLPKDIKKDVDNIVKVMAKNPKIQSIYKEWNDINRKKLALYYDSSKKPDVPLEENKEFRSIKNMIIESALKYNSAPLKHEVSLVQEGIKLLHSLAKLIDDDIDNQLNNFDSKVDRKLRAKINEKKIAQGQKIEGQGYSSMSM